MSPADDTAALYFSPLAAINMGSSVAETPNGPVEYTGWYSSAEEGEKHYGWSDKKLVWQGPKSAVGYTGPGVAPQPYLLLNLNKETPLTALNVPAETGKTDMKAIMERLSAILKKEEEDARVIAGAGENLSKKLTAFQEAALRGLQDKDFWLPPRQPEKYRAGKSLFGNGKTDYNTYDKIPAARPAPPPPPPKVNPLAEAGADVPPLDVIFCQDASDVHAEARTIAQRFGAKGYKIGLTSVDNQQSLLDELEERRQQGRPGPDAVFMDVGGVGAPAALKVLKWFDTHRPSQALPALNFLSLSCSMAIEAAGRLRDADPRVQPSFVDAQELEWLSQHLEGGSAGRLPDSTAFREFLNKRLGTALPLEHREDSSYSDAIKKLKGVTNDRVLDAWLNGKFTPAETLERMRAYATGVTTALKEGLYGPQAGAEGIAADARFYASAGFPARGEAVFSLAEVEQAYNRDGRKPVLFMQAYDPAVVPVLASGHLGGLVVTSPYMASHLKLLCETHMVSGLFGMKPPGPKSLSAEFNEEALPDLPPYFSGPAAEVAGKTVKPGQQVLVGLGGDGLALTPPADTREAADPVNADNNEKLRTDLRNLRQIDKCFAAFFRGQGAAFHGVKANVDSTDKKTLASVPGIGLVRTEQMVATNTNEVVALKKYLLRGSQEAREDLFNALQSDYLRFMRELDKGKAVKIRLFDFVHREILNKEEQKEFLERHGKLDFHGGEALDTFPELYKRQIRAIFRALDYSYGDSGIPLEIMMPAVRTEEDVLKVKAIVDAEAKEQGISPKRYSFGVMAETLEACKNISDIAKHVDFISFGTNDLTSEYFNMSRSDLKAHAGFAAKNGYDPFRKLAPEILALMQKTVEEGRGVRPALRVDVCGAQAADPDTAAALCKAGVDNVSVAPTLNNLYALPVLMNYRLYDALKPAEPAAAVRPAPAAGA